MPTELQLRFITNSFLLNLGSGNLSLIIVQYGVVQLLMLLCMKIIQQGGRDKERGELKVID